VCPEAQQRASDSSKPLRHRADCSIFWRPSSCPRIYDIVDEGPSEWRRRRKSGCGVDRWSRLYMMLGNAAALHAGGSSSPVAKLFVPSTQPSRKLMRVNRTMGSSCCRWHTVPRHGGRQGLPLMPRVMSSRYASRRRNAPWRLPC
jgi:hypothetical protein